MTTIDPTDVSTSPLFNARDRGPVHGGEGGRVARRVADWIREECPGPDVHHKGTR
jgi:hypothetical protein